MESSGPEGRSYREGFIIQRGLSQGTHLHKSLRKLAEGRPGGKRKIPRSWQRPWGIRQANTVGPGQGHPGWVDQSIDRTSSREKAGALGPTAG